MDPSASLCILYDTLQQPHPNPDLESIWYNHDDNIKLIPNLIPSDSQSLPQYCDTQRYNILQSLKPTFETPEFKNANLILNPFENIGNSIFKNYNAIKLANIDAVHHVTNTIFTFDKQTSNLPFTFCDISSEPSAEYLQYRFSNSTGYGISPNTNLSNKFVTFYNSASDIYDNWSDFISQVIKLQGVGVDLVVADNNADNEFEFSQLFLIQSIIGIGCTKLNGNFVIKIIDTVTSISAQILFILSQCFQQIQIFKPVSSRSITPERFVICKGRLSEIQSLYQLLSEAITKNEYWTSLFSEPLPTQFEQWLTDNNNRSINSRLQMGQQVLFYLRGQIPQLPRYNIPKFLIIWNLPDTVITSQNSLLH